MPEPLTLIFFKHTVNTKFPPTLAKIYEGSYNSGWLSNNHDEPFIIQWGNSKDMNMAKGVMLEVLQKQGERPVLFYDKEILIEKTKAGIILLSKEVYQDIITVSEKWH